ncbi:hypothetical protein GE061_012953 [Apolygus lucorum]|uniref:Uncharacterized protein n=1 Tax=Apolygus lucorum TaxID=248454 RepID=A0A8S9XTS2_APOLU|nr:hypothetical protein GE061_012953 [Apolygus lucorum]
MYEGEGRHFDLPSNRSFSPLSMAIADAEPKKSEVDVTSTGSSSGSKEMKKPRGPIKYSSLKDFSFSVSDVWDDRNICTFIECCHANFEDLKSHNGSEENKVWEKIAKSGLERSGSVNCFNVNYCLELAKCLKSFVSKNEKKMMDNEIFKKLYDNVVDLLPYFAPVSVSRHRSRSKSVEMSKPEKTELSPNIKGDHLTIPPFGTPSESTQVLRKVAKILNQYKIDEFVKTSSRNAIWKEVTANVEKDFGVLVNPRMFLEGYKRSVVGFVRSHPVPKERAKIFLEQIDDLLPFFDHIAPRSMKKSEFLSQLKPTEAEEVPVKELTVENLDSKKRKELEEENYDNPTSPKSKRRLNSGGESVADSGYIPLTTNTTTPLRTYLKKRNISESDSSAKKSRLGEDSDACSDGVPGSVSMDYLLDDWNSNEDIIEKTPEKEPEPAPAPIETEPPPVEAPIVKRRGRKPKNAAASTSVPKPKPEPLAKKVMPLRQVTRSKKDAQVDVPQEEKPKEDSVESLPVSSSKELVSAVRATPNPPRKVDQPEDKVPTGSTKLNTNDKNKDDSLFLVPSESTRVEHRGESEDSEIEDVPLMGTNIRIHSIRGKVEQSKSHSIIGNMNPIVLLDKISTDKYLPPPSSSARTKPIPRSIQTRGKRIEPAAVAPPTVATTERRRPGRPRKPPPAHRARAVPPRREPVPVVSTSSVEIVRQPVGTSLQSLDRNYIVRELETRPSTLHSRHLMPMTPPSSSLSENFSRSDVAPPEWFERFVMETRRHEMWKVHQLMKMQQELLDSECKKRGVLEKILSALRKNT